MAPLNIIIITSKLPTINITGSQQLLYLDPVTDKIKNTRGHQRKGHPDKIGHSQKKGTI